jgi:hypothetical protein
MAEYLYQIGLVPFPKFIFYSTISISSSTFLANYFSSTNSKYSKALA